MRDEIAAQLKPRLFGLLLVISAILLLLLAFLLMVFLQPAPGQYYSRWVVVLVAFILLAGYVLLFPGLWKTFVGPGVGMFTGVLKGAAIGAMLVGLAMAGFSAAAVYGMAKHPISASSSRSGSSWDWD